MATRKKGAAGFAPADAPTITHPANAAPTGISAELPAGYGAGNAASATDGPAPAQVIVAQQPGQIASVLAAPVLETGAPEGGVVSETVQAGPELMPDGHPAEIELGGRTVMVMAHAERGRWRIGRHFTRTPQPVNIDELTEDEVGRLLADPELIVSLDD